MRKRPNTVPGEGVVLEGTPEGRVHGKGRGVSRGLKILVFITLIVCLPVLFILLTPFKKPVSVLPVSTEPQPFLDGVLGNIEKQLKILDQKKQGYPEERQLQSLVPKGVRLLVVTGSPDLLVLEVSRGDSVWRTMTHERGKPEATTLVTVYKQFKPNAKKK